MRKYDPDRMHPIWESQGTVIVIQSALTNLLPSIWVLCSRIHIDSLHTHTTEQSMYNSIMHPLACSALRSLHNPTLLYGLLHHAASAPGRQRTPWPGSGGRRVHLQELSFADRHDWHGELDVKLAPGIVCAHRLTLAYYDHRVLRSGCQGAHLPAQDLPDVLALRTGML